MRILTIASLALLGGLACKPNEPGYNGFPVTDFFPLDEVREWRFRSEDTTVPHELVANKAATGRIDSEDGFTEIFDIPFTKSCISDDETCVEGEAVMGWEQSAGQQRGAFFWSLSGASGEQSYTPPIKLASGRTAVGDTVTTDTGGSTWTSTFVMTTDCEIVWNPAWTNCMLLELDDGGAGTGFAGTYWLAAGYNVVAFEIDAFEARWSLSNHEFSEE